MSQLKEFRGIEGTNFFEEDRGFQALLGDLLKERDRPKCSRRDPVRGTRLRTWRSGQRLESDRTLPRIVKYDRAVIRSSELIRHAGDSVAARGGGVRHPHGGAAEQLHKSLSSICSTQGEASLTVRSVARMD